jgi:hypothetical protein
MTPREGKCPRCNRWVALLEGGEMVCHAPTRAQGRLGVWGGCPWSGRPPAETRITDAPGEQS